MNFGYYAKNQISADFMYIENTWKISKVHICRWYPSPGKNTDITFFKGRSILHRCLQYLDFYWVEYFSYTLEKSVPLKGQI